MGEASFGGQRSRDTSASMGPNPGLVFQIEIPIVEHGVCQEAYASLKRKVTRDMICAGEKEGKIELEMGGRVENPSEAGGHCNGRRRREAEEGKDDLA